MVWFDAGAVFKFGTMVNEYIGYTDSRLTINDKAKAGVSEAPSDGNIMVSKAGWYILYVKAEVKGSDYAFTMTFYGPNVYVFGDAASGFIQTIGNSPCPTPKKATSNRPPLEEPEKSACASKPIPTGGVWNSH